MNNIEILKNVPNNFIYLVLFLGVIYTSTNILKANISHVFGAVLAFFIIKYLRTQENLSTNNFFQTTDYKYKLIGFPEYFYIDVNLINLYFSIYKWKNLNPINYNESIKSTNNVLMIRALINENNTNCVEQYEIAVEQSKNALNMLHGFIYNISQKQLVQKLNNVLQRLQELLTRHLEVIRKTCDKNKNININKRYIQDPDGPKAHSTNVSSFDQF